eukprot:2398390-Pyramimonas_sp.AAC.1
MARTGQITSLGSMSASHKLRADVFIAAKNGDTDSLLDFLMSNPGAIYDQDENGNTILHLAARYGHNEIVKFMKEIDCPKKHVDVSIRNARKRVNSRRYWSNIVINRTKVSRESRLEICASRELVMLCDWS